VLRYIATWLDDHRPPEAPLTFLHGEFQSANIISLPSGALIATDWEMARIGDPREDLGYYKQVSTVQPPDVIGWDDVAFCADYCRKTGLSPEIVNPRTVAYFSILPMGGLLGPVLGQLRRLISGESASLMVAYNHGVFLTWSTAWLRLIERLTGEEAYAR